MSTPNIAALRLQTIESLTNATVLARGHDHADLGWMIKETESVIKDMRYGMAVGMLQIHCAAQIADSLLASCPDGTDESIESFLGIVAIYWSSRAYGVNDLPDAKYRRIGVRIVNQ